MSLPARGAWVETTSENVLELNQDSRSPQGERGLKPRELLQFDGQRRRSPQGERGLKQGMRTPLPGNRQVAPRKGSVG